MNLAKHDAETDMEMDMTPMIDVVFLLIIFFMIISDMSQKDLEELTLPVATTATEDKPDPKEIRPVVNIPHSGAIITKRKTYYLPETHDKLADPYHEVKRLLSLAASSMPTKGLNEDGSGPQVPDNPLLIRADSSTPFKHLQKVMEVCGLQGIQIWKIQLAASVPEADK
ncbi:MAG: biopolymer transport protein ExbD [Planctomycetota bacterium]|jgi:biopolymer transport protein ExbD